MFHQKGQKIIYHVHLFTMALHLKENNFIEMIVYGCMTGKLNK